MKKLIFPILCLSIFTIGCSDSSDEDNQQNGGEQDTPTEQPTGLPDEYSIPTVADIEYTEPDEVIDPTDEDYAENATFSYQIKITYDGNTSTVEGATEGVEVTTDGANVVVNSTAEAVEYILTGQSDNGSFKLYGKKKFKLTLDNVAITNPIGAAINIQASKRAFVNLADGSVNTLTDGAKYTTVTGEDMKGCIFSEGQMVFGGGGKLTVRSIAKHGICSDDYIMIRKGVTLDITSEGKDGIHANDKVVINGGHISIASSADGIECEEGFVQVNGGFTDITSGGEGIKVSYDGTDTAITPYAQINNGKLTVTTSGQKASGIKSTGNVEMRGGVVNISVSGDGSKGLSSDKETIIAGGQIDITTSGNGLYVADDNDISSPSGIKSDGDCTISGSRLRITSSGSAGKGISTDGQLTIAGGNIDITTTGKQYIYQSLDSSAKGIKSEGNLTITDGVVVVTTSGGEGSEGIESKATLTVDGGIVMVTAYDDAINAASAIVVNGGKVSAYSTNNDGIDSNGTLTITGGTVISVGTSQPEEGFDCDNNQFKITGGELLGIGGATSKPTTNVCTQNSVIYGGSSTSGNYICIKNSKDEAVMCYKLPRQLNQMTMLFSAPSLTTDSYTVYNGGTPSGGTSFSGYCSGSTYSGGTKLTTFTTSSNLTYAGNTTGGGMGGDGGQGGGPGGRP